MPVNKRSIPDNSASATGSRRRPGDVATRLARLVTTLVVTASLSTAGLAVHSARALADDGDGPEGTHHVEPPPAPHEHGGTLEVEIHGAPLVPLARDTICPPSALQCVLGAGLGVGAQLEWRTAERVGLFAGYDFFMLDSGGVYELGTLHALRGGVRYTLDDSLVVHPFLDLAVGLLLFGDTANVAAGGGVVTAGGGAEMELSESVLFVTSAEVWMFATGPFTTRDGATRSADFGVNVALQLTVGVAILIGPSVVPP